MNNDKIIERLLRKFNEKYGENVFGAYGKEPIDLFAPSLHTGVYSSLHLLDENRLKLSDVFADLKVFFDKLKQLDQDDIKRIILLLPVERDELIDEFIEFGKSKLPHKYEFELWDWPKIKSLFASEEQYDISQFEPDNYFVNRVPASNIHQLFGIEENLKTIDNTIDASLSPLVIYNPIAGTGKTALALAYAFHFDYQKKFDHVAFVGLSGYFKLDFILAFDGYTGFKYNSARTPDDNYQHLLKLLSGYSGRNLLIIDNLENAHQVAEVIKLASLLKWKIIITSRLKIFSFENFYLEHPDKKAAIQIFEYYAKNEKDRKAAEQLIDSVYNHPWAVEFMAKTIDHFYPKLNARKLLEIFEEKSKRVYHLYEYVDRSLSKNQVLLQRTILKYVMAIYQYQIRMFSKGERKVLKILSVLPDTLVSFEDLSAFLNYPDKKYDYSDDFLALISKGWINADKNYFRIHKFASWVLHKKIKPDYLKVQDYYEFLNNRLNSSELKYVPFADALINKMTDSSINSVPMTVFLASVFDALGDSLRAKFYYEISAKTLENRLAYDYNVETLELLVITLFEAEYYDKAIFYALQVADYYKSNREFVKLAEIYGTLAELYAVADDPEHAIYYVDNALDILSEQENYSEELKNYLEKLHAVLSENFNNYIKEKDRENWFRRFFI